MIDGLTVWIGFNAVLVGLFVLDFFVLTRKDHVIGLKEASLLTLFWTLVAVAVGIWVIFAGSGDLGGRYFTAYVAERALSIDNLFVFLIIFGYFKMPQALQARALLYGIVGALIARAAFIAIGVAAIAAFSWILFILGAFLIYTAYKLAFAGGQEMDPSKNLAARAARRVFPVSDDYDGHRFFTRVNGVRTATPFMLAILVLASTDVVFAVDSIPTVFGITTDGFIVWSSNAMAVLGMRPLFFLLAEMVRLFKYLQYGLSLILGFVGTKMILEEAFQDKHLTSENGDIFLSLALILTILAGSVALSKIIPDDDDDGRGGEDHESAAAAAAGGK